MTANDQEVELNRESNVAPGVEAKRRGCPAGVIEAESQFRQWKNSKLQEERMISQGVQRSERIKSREEANSAGVAILPKTFKEAAESSECAKWEGVMRSELDSLKQHQQH